jgi:hypothetical protein
MPEFKPAARIRRAQRSRANALLDLYPAATAARATIT